jgi:hypothetical protein
MGCGAQHGHCTCPHHGTKAKGSNMNRNRAEMDNADTYGHSYGLDGARSASRKAARMTLDGLPDEDADTAREQERNDDWEKAADEACRLDPTNAEARSLRARVYGQIGRLEECIKEADGAPPSSKIAAACQQARPAPE